MTLFVSALLLLFVVTFQPIERLVLGDELHTAPALRRLRPADIREVAFGPDPHEDYAESGLPIVLCQATVSPVRGRALTLIVSAGDAARLRAWAAGKGITVRDPEDYSERRNTPA